MRFVDEFRDADKAHALAAKIAALCEPATVDYAMELSGPVAGAVDEAVQVILGLVAEAGRARQSNGNPRAAGPETPGTQEPGPPGADDPEIPETTGEGVSHVSWHSR